MTDIKIENIQDALIELDGAKVLIDSNVVQLYGVETKRINEAVKNNPERFPVGYILEVDTDAKKQLVDNFDRFKMLKHSSVAPKAFTEKVFIC